MAYIGLSGFIRNDALKIIYIPIPSKTRNHYHNSIL